MLSGTIRKVIMEIDNRVTGRTKILGIIGNPVEHSISPQLHNYISRYLGVDAVYVPFKVEKAQLGRAVDGLRALNIKGFNVTIPYKNDIISFIDEVSEEAQLIGAVNTVKNVDGRLYGYNTDAEGFVRSLEEEGSTGFNGNDVSIIGAGGAARALAVKAALDGAKNIAIINRSVERAHEIADLINNKINNSAFDISLSDSNVEKVFAESKIVINTTSVGMYPDIEKTPVETMAGFSERHIVCDIIYNPERTVFLKSAADMGCKVINGHGMLFYQGIYAYQIWMDMKFSHAQIKALHKSFMDIIKSR